MAIISKVLGSRAAAWLDRIIARLYAAVVKEDIPPGFQSHVFVMRLTGLWPTATDSPKYKWLTIAFFTYVGILGSLSQFANIFFVNSVPEAMESQFLSLTCCATTIKAAIIYWRRDDIREMFRIHVALSGSGSGIDKRIVRMNLFIHLFYTSLYFVSLCAQVMQSYLQPDDAPFPSTSKLPYDFARRHAVFVTGLVFQTLGNTGISLWTSVEDSFYIALMSTTCGHVMQLKERLRTMSVVAVDMNERNSLFYMFLCECCRRYEKSLRYVKISV